METIFIAANQDMGIHIDGADLGPRLLSKYFESKESPIHVVNKSKANKERDKDNKRKNLKFVNEFNERLYREVLNCNRKTEIPFVFGGDHSVAIATALASIKMHNKLGIIWFDAHADYNTFSTTLTGNLHGLPLAALNGLCPELTYFHDGNYYSPDNTVIIGCRDIDELEWINLQNNNVKVFTTKELKRSGINAVFEEAFRIAEEGTSGIHVSYDLDAIDPLYAPGVSVPAVDGLSEEEAYQAAEYISSHAGIVRSIDLVEFNPLYDKEKKTERLAVNIVNKLTHAFTLC